MKKYILIIVTIFLMSFGSFAQNGAMQDVSTTRANIKHGVSATYSEKGGLTLTFDESLMTKADKKALASGTFEIEGTDKSDWTLTDEECAAMKAPKGTTILPGKYEIVSKGKGVRTAAINTSRSGIRHPNIK